MIFECKADNIFLSKAMPSSLEMYAREVLNDDFDINKPDGIQQAMRINL